MLIVVLLLCVFAVRQLFERVRAEHDGIDLETKICVIPGDMTLPQLGLSDTDQQKLVRDVSIVFHLAATVSFNEPLKYLECLILYCLQMF